jgi:hypothetical protein
MKKCTCLYKAGCGRTLGVLPPWVAPGGGGWSLRYLCLCFLPPPFLPSPPGTSSALPPSECTHTPIPWGSSKLTSAISPTSLEEGARISQALSPAVVHPSGPDQRDAALYR